MVGQPDDAERACTYRCTELPPALQRWDASSVLTRHAGHDPARCLPYAAALARLSTPLP
ncbi:hypothetical protein [Nocardia harenae]|uniref:hypothetical protein n=1 Tax=Nocardia harenae TaxID=358707 RepID=UPI000AF61B1B|nr:hypothetical protein [Nocardia harenae]